jgi:hypothetical protein
MMDGSSSSARVLGLGSRNSPGQNKNIPLKEENDKIRY